MSNSSHSQLSETSTGERVSPLTEDSCFQAHLSLYRFAQPWCAGRTILDAGCGQGYGSAVLAQFGADHVHGIDNNPAAIAFAQHYFAHPNLDFHTVDMTAITTFSDQSFDLIFSSNVLEHLTDVGAFLRHAWRLLRPDGTLIIAVPPITTPYLRAANLLNPYHVNIWSPQQWNSVFQRYFAATTYYNHYLEQRGKLLDLHDMPLEMVPASAWRFEAVSFDEFMTVPSMTSVFVLRNPQPTAALPPQHTPMQLVDDSFSMEQRESIVMELAATVVQQTQQLRLAAATNGQLHTAVAAHEQTILAKNAHIRQLEEHIRRLEQGRVMRLLRWLKR